MNKSQDSIPYYDFHAPRLYIEGVNSESQTLLSEQLLLPMIEALPPGGKVMDLGCGWGRDLTVMHRAGFRAEGIEGSAEMVKLAKAALPEVPVQKRNFLFWEPEASYWDGIWSNQAFSHLSIEAIQRMAAISFKALKPGGVFGFVVHEGEVLFEDREGDLTGPSRWFHPQKEKSLSSMIEQTGFRIEKIGRYSGLLMILAVRIRSA